MANWIECTGNKSGDKILVNFDNATAIHRNDVQKYTEVSFVGEKANSAN